MQTSTASRLFDRYHQPICRYLRRMVGDPRLAEDLTQEVFLRVVRCPEADLAEGREAAWLFSIARNLMRDHGRQRLRRPAPEDLAGRLVPINSMQHLACSLGEALEQIEETDRDVFLLREVGGLGYLEIATVCELTPDAVRSRIHRARLALRELLAPALTRARGRLRKEVQRDSGST